MQTGTVSASAPATTVSRKSAMIMILMMSGKARARPGMRDPEGRVSFICSCSAGAQPLASDQQRNEHDDEQHG
jgi:hypothetical protein